MMHKRRSYKPIYVGLLFSILCLWVSSCDRSNPEPEVQETGGLVDVTAASGITFTHMAGVDGSYYMPEYMGPGSAFFDYDNDGDQDILFVNGAWHSETRPMDKSTTNQLWRQEPGGKFVNVTAGSGLADSGFGMGAAVADIDNDGDLDVYISNLSADQLYRNNGDGTFTNITKQAGIDNDEWGCSAAFFDYDRDGFLDLYVTNYVRMDRSVKCFDAGGRPEYCGPDSYPGVADCLYRNNGDGTFTDVSASSGIGARVKRGLGVVAADFSGDGWIDIYVANDGEENLLWINQQDGRFREEAMLRGAALNEVGQAEAGMGIAIGDVDHNGEFDLLVTHLDGESNTLYMNEGAGGFRDDSQAAGMGALKLVKMTGFGVGFPDLDLDGQFDVVIGNGRVKRSYAQQAEDDHWAPYDEPNLVMLGQGNGRFLDASNRFAAFCEPRATTRGLAFADYDNDGDLDVLVNNAGTAARLYRNEAGNGKNWIGLKMIDPRLKRADIGARAAVYSAAGTQHLLLTPFYSYLCSNDLRLRAGLGHVAEVDSLIVDWSNGSREKFTTTVVNRYLTLERGSGRTITGK